MTIARIALAIVLVALSLIPAQAQAPKRGGILNAMQGEDLPTGFSIHETSTIFGLWPVAPCFKRGLSAAHIPHPAREHVDLDGTPHSDRPAPSVRRKTRLTDRTFSGRLPSPHHLTPAADALSYR